jgi:DNA polymerase-3 subunit gamma/tau
VRDMLGLADRALVFDLLEAVMKGDVKTALDVLAGQYAAGASPVVVVQDLLELVHWLTRIKVAPDGAADPALAENERTRGVVMAEKLSMGVLTRAWQMLLKGLSEARAAPMPLQAVEMVLVRLAYAADLPTPADAVKSLESGAAAAVRTAAPVPPRAPSRPMMSSGQAAIAADHVSQPAAVAQPTAEAIAQPQSFAEVVKLFVAKREAILSTHLHRNVHLVRFEQGLIEFKPGRLAPSDLAGQVGKMLTAWTGQRWVVSVANAGGAPTLYDQEIDAAKADPLVKSILEAFPGATVEAIKPADK